MKSRDSRVKQIVFVVIAAIFLIQAIPFLFALVGDVATGGTDNLYEDVLPVVQQTPQVRRVEPVYESEYNEFYEIDLVVENAGWYSDSLRDYRFECTPVDGDSDSMYIYNYSSYTTLSDAAADYLPAGRSVPCHLVMVAPLGSSGMQVELQYETSNDTVVDLCTIQLP